MRLVRIMTGRWRVAACVFAGALAATAQVSISIDKATQYQIIEGFGYEPNFMPWTVYDGPFPTQVDLDTTGVYDSTVTELGATMIRTRMEPEFQADSGVFDCSALQGEHGWFDMVRRLRVISEREQEPMLLIGQVWSPPGWMKVGGEADCKNTSEADCVLKVGYEDDFGRHLASYVQMMRDSTQVDYYAISIQDEPLWRQPWESCKYTAIRYKETLKGVVPVFHERGLQTLFFGAEHINWAYPSQYEAAVREDPEALGYMHAWAFHNYSRNSWHIRADTGSYSGSTPTQKPLWKTSGGQGLDSLNDWTTSMEQANNIWNFLRNSKGSVWLWFTLMANSSGGEFPKNALMVNGKRTAAYYMSIHYFRYIRPGARQIGSESSDDSVEVVAFNHSRNDCVTLVLLNNSSMDKTVDGISGSDVPVRFERVVSTLGAKLDHDSVSAGDNIVLPPNSLTTLVSGRYRGTGYTNTTAVRSVNSPTIGARAPRGRIGPARVYTIDGRIVERAGVGARALGVYITRSPRGTQRSVLIGRLPLD